MIKIKRKNYIKEKAQAKFESNINHQLAGFSNFSNEDKWRGKSNHNCLTTTEQNYEINEIIKKYQSSKDEIKGYSSKYLLQLSDLLGQKDKNFIKKRFELYNNRINGKKVNKNLNKEKEIKTLSNVNSKLDKIFNSKKSDTVTMFCTSFRKNKIKKINNKKNYDTVNNNLPIKSKSLKTLLTTKNKNNLLRSKGKEAQSVLITQLYGNQKNEDFYDKPLGGKEEFLLDGDKEKYQEFLKKEYNFYNNDNLNQVLYIYEKNKRIELFKNIKNYKFLKLKKNLAFRNNFITKILREKNNNDSDLPKISFKSKNNKKMNFIKDCEKICENIQKKLC